ncbi:heme oxygenase (decycling) 1 [Podila clonocystis]|nr:heme oxygenase (decycling) 1 [Podila clonocystis]
MIARAYVRYLGDLSAGQILAKKLQAYSELPEGQGVTFISLTGSKTRVKFKELFRKRLNQVGMDEHL